MPFSGPCALPDVLPEGGGRQHLAHLMPCLITEFARRYDVLRSIFAAIHSGLHVFGSALEAVERSGQKAMPRCKECLVTLPHKIATVEASPILLVGVQGSEFCQFVRFAHIAHPCFINMKRMCSNP
nr:hypothetical protein [Mesorhizobium sp.]